MSGWLPTTGAGWLLAVVLLAVLLLVAALFEVAVRRRQLHRWLPAYLLQRRPRRAGGPRHVLFCFADHFEPRWAAATPAEEVARVEGWCERYRAVASRHRDADGCTPRHTFFYPEEEYRPEHLDRLAELCRAGFGEIEVHLHHDHDTSAGLAAKLERFVTVLHARHGALAADPATGRPVFGFIHGNWCLDNARSDGRYCGVDDEIQVLARAGCYADFTLPSAPSETQTRKINSIYYATDDPARPKSHDRGVDVAAGRAASGDLMIVQGPLTLDWRDRKWGLMPRIENGDVRRRRPATPRRIDLWIRQAIHVRGRPDWVFVKVHTHGVQEHDSTAYFDAMDRLFTDLEARYNDGIRHVLHYVTARELYNVVKAAERGASGDPGRFRDDGLPRPANAAGSRL